MKRYFFAILMVVLLLFIPACDQTNTGTQTQASESVADTVQTEMIFIDTTDAITVDTLPETKPVIETDPIPDTEPAPKLPIELHSQNEDQDFGFTVTVKDGLFAKGEQLTLEVTLINQMDSAYTWTGSSSAYHAWVELVCTTTHGIYQILPEPYPMNDDVGTFEVQSGGKGTESYCFLIPQDAPVGEYALFCSFQKTTAQFDGVFRLD